MSFRFTNKVLVLLLAIFCCLPIMSVGAEQIEASISFQTETDEYSALEERIAQEVIASGQMLGTDPRFEDVIAILAERGRSLFSQSAGLSQGWIEENLRDVLPEVENKMLAAAIHKATSEVAQGFSGAIGGISSGDTYSKEDAQHTLWRSTLEGIRAAASVSDLLFLNTLELEYSLSEGGIDEYSVLTVLPFWNSADLRHNIFMQGSFANKEVEDIGANTSGRRDTVNAGLVYRYITEDEQHMFGANAFFDHQWPYHHNRMSLGVDYKTSLYGVSFNKYIGLSDWRGRDDGYEEKALGGEDLEVSGRLPEAPELELFAKGYHWSQEQTPVLNPDGDDIWGYQFAAEYTPINALTIRSQATKDNEMDDLEGQITLRLNYTFGQSWDDLWKRPSYNLESVVDRRFEKVRRNNEIRVQVRQDPNVTALVTFAQGASVSVGQSLPFGTEIITSGGAGDSATVIFGNGARLDVGQSTQVTFEKDQIVLNAGLIQFTSADGGIKVIAVPGGTIQLIGTDVDVRVSGGTKTLRVRDGAADFTDDTGTTRVNAEELAEAQDGDAQAPQIRAEGTAIYDTHTSEAHAQLDLVGPTPSNPKAAPYADEAVSITGTLASGNTLTFTVNLSAAVTITGSPRLHFTLGGNDRYADYASGSGSETLIFTYDVVVADGSLSNIVVDEIEKNGGTLIGSNGALMVRTVSGTLSGTVPSTIIMGLTACPAGNLTVPTDVGCARLFGTDVTDLTHVGVFAGELPDTTEVFAKRCDQGMTWDGANCAGVRLAIKWKNADTESDTVDLSGGAVTIEEATNGPNNTDVLTDDEASGTHPAAESCRAMGASWYLPALTELDVIYSNLAEGEYISDDDTDNPLTTIVYGGGGANAGNGNGPLVSGFNTQYYWTSSESTNISASWIQRFSDGALAHSVKTQNRNLRCVRR